MLLRLVNEPKIILYLLCSQIGLSLLMPFPAPQKSDTGKFLQKGIYEIQVVASRAHMCTCTHACAHTHTHPHTHTTDLVPAKYQRVVAYKPWKFTSHSSGGFKSEFRVPTWLGESHFPGPRLLIVSSHGKRGKRALWGGGGGLFYKGINAIHEGSTLMI